jgi:ubiquinone biosynthesis protein COQ9
MKKRLKKSSFVALDDLILDSMLAVVPFEGWTESAYAEALKQAGASRAGADDFFPNGVRDVVAFFGNRADEAMQKRIEAERGFARMRVRDKVTFAVRARLEALAPAREAMRRLMVWYAMPHHFATGIKRVYKTVDLIWKASGDTSTDYNFYTKRMLLSGVLKAVVLFWLSDDSPGQTATWEFLDRRIGEVMKLGKSISLLKEFKPSEIVDLVRDKVRKAI